jgi:hypothetical protein
MVDLVRRGLLAIVGRAKEIKSASDLRVQLEEAVFRGGVATPDEQSAKPQGALLETPKTDADGKEG